MADINTVTIIGRLTKDEDLKYTANGMAIGTLSIAIDRSIKRDGEWIKEANFFEVAVFGKQAESLKQYLTKGKQVGVSGYLKQDRWQDQQSGQNRSKVTIVANDIQLLGGRDNNAGSQNNESNYEGGYSYGN